MQQEHYKPVPESKKPDESQKAIMRPKYKTNISYSYHVNSSDTTIESQHCFREVDGSDIPVIVGASEKKNEGSKPGFQAQLRIPQSQIHLPPRQILIALVMAKTARGR